MHHWLFFPFFGLLWKWARAFLRTFCTKSHWLKSLAMQPKLLAEQDLVSTFFFTSFCSRTYQRKVRWKGKTSTFGFFLWIGQSYKGKAQTWTWLRSSQVQKSQSRRGPLALSHTSPLQRRQVSAGGPGRAQQERCEGCRVTFGGETPGGLRRSSLQRTWGACGSIKPQQGRIAGAPQRKNASLHLIRTTRIVAPKICLISKFSGIIVLH